MYISPNIPFRLVAQLSGDRSDLQLLQEDKWLMNTEVQYWLREQGSRWLLTMIYIDIFNPLRFICRRIDQYPSRQKAETFARILQRAIRKDARGTLKTNRDALHICLN